MGFFAKLVRDLEILMSNRQSRNLSKEVKI